MKLYAIRDRLLDYYMKPFVGESDPQVLAAMANLINGEAEHVFKQAAQHFEVWRLAEIDEKTGQVGGDREFLIDCPSLIRPSIRQGADRGAEAIPRPNGGRGGPPAETTPGADAGQRAPQNASQAEDRQPAPTNPVPG